MPAAGLRDFYTFVFMYKYCYGCLSDCFTRLVSSRTAFSVIYRGLSCGMSLSQVPRNYPIVNSNLSCLWGCLENIPSKQIIIDEFKIDNNCLLFCFLLRNHDIMLFYCLWIIYVSFFSVDGFTLLLIIDYTCCFVFVFFFYFFFLFC